MQFADFVTCAFNQIVNNLAKSHYRWGQASDVVVRMPTGGGVGAGPFHSQSTEAWFFKVPGLQIVFPSSARDAKGLLNAAIANPNPVLFYEHKALYRSQTDEVPEGYYETPIGKARIVREGSECSIITYGLGVRWAMELAETYDLEVLDLRSLLPWDQPAVQKTVENTGRVLLLCEDTQTGSVLSEIAAWIGEELFQYLDAPVKRLGSLDTPVPFASPLEENFLAKSRLAQTLDDLLNY